MNNERFNLLPRSRRRALVYDHVLRLGVVTMLLVVVLTFIAAVLLIPTYTFLTAGLSAKGAYLASLETASSSPEENALPARLALFSRNVASLTDLKKNPSASAIMRETLSIPHRGIAINNFSYARGATTTKPSIVMIAGTAATRDALRSYQTALQGASFVRLAKLPVSAYAKETDIAFTISVTLRP